MDDTDKIIAAIFAAHSLTGKSVGPPAYLDTYEQFLAVIEERRKWALQNKKPMKISKSVLERASKKPPR